MTPKQAIAWFKGTFQTDITAVVSGTPFTVNMIAAVAYQETGYIWAPLVSAHSTAEVLQLCCGDTIDAPRRSAFPASRAALEAVQNGGRMFRIAREALEQVADKTGLYAAQARQPDKFFRGFGIFQYDLQFYKERNFADADFFLEKKWHQFSECLSRFVVELKRALKTVYGAGKTSLTNEEFVYVAVAYNKGSADPSKGHKQGHKNEDGEYYGELVWEYLGYAETTAPVPGTTPPVVIVNDAPRDEPIGTLKSGTTPPPYPGRIIKRNSADMDSARLIQKRLRELGYLERKADGTERPLSVDGDFGNDTVNAVELFQFRHTDSNGRQLTVDGEVGPATWASLFGTVTLPPVPVPAGILAAALEAASGEVGVMEKPPGSNRGARVEEYLASVGLGGGFAWCAAFVFWCFRQGSRSLGSENPAVKTAGVLDMWNRAGREGFVRVSAEQARENPGLLTPGMVFVFSTGGGFGHTGFVAGVRGGEVETIEGNTDTGGSRNGIGVFRRSRRISSVNCGFIDYSRKA